jgi:ADP-ribose pyrophosphatase YjhB (NUDIX family)
MENGETLLEAAVRETREEACARVEISNLFTIFSLPEINQIYVMFLADLIEPDFAPGLESLECKLYSEKQIPWSEIAFPTITQTLRFYFQDLKCGSFSQHIGDFLRRDGELVMRPQLKSDGTEIVTHW